MDSDNHTLAEDKRLLDSLVFLIDDQYRIKKVVEKKPMVYFSFNPNEASVETLQSLGIPRFISTRIVNYRSKGGSFSVKGDLLKIYDFPDTLFQVLKDYIELPDRRPTVVKKFEVPKSRIDSTLGRSLKEIEKVEKDEFLIIDLSTADSTSLKRLRGIGSSYAKRIISYRRLLGGYHSVEQLKEVYGMNAELYVSITPHFILPDSLPLQKISINLASFKELLAHPYISYEQTKEILNAKSEKGKFREAKDMFRLKLMDSTTIAKLLPYLHF